MRSGIVEAMRDQIDNSYRRSEISAPFGGIERSSNRRLDRMVYILTLLINAQRPNMRALTRTLRFAPVQTQIRRSLYTHPSFSLADPSLLGSTGWINGQPTPAKSGKIYTLVDPGTAEQWHEVSDMGIEETETAIQAAHSAFPDFSKIPGRTRGKMIMEMDRLFLEAKDDLAQIAVMECGKTLAEAAGEVDVACKENPHPKIFLADNSVILVVDGGRSREE